MHPEDRVLIGVINRKRDFNYLLQENWYRIPEQRMHLGVHAEYIGFFLSGSPFKEMSGGIHHYGQLKGVELRSRRDLIPSEADHPRADHTYYRLSIGQLTLRKTPILNPTKRAIAFVYTTWDRFIAAKVISDLYSDADHFVDRIHAVLRRRGVTSQQLWEAEKRIYATAPGLRIPCKDGVLNISNNKDTGDYYLDETLPDDRIFREIMQKVKDLGGPAILSIPGD